jgi:hypothetical protein
MEKATGFECIMIPVGYVVRGLTVLTLLPRTENSYPELNSYIVLLQDGRATNVPDHLIAAIVCLAIQTDINTGACRFRTITLKVS